MRSRPIEDVLTATLADLGASAARQGDTTAAAAAAAALESLAGPTKAERLWIESQDAKGASGGRLDPIRPLGALANLVRAGARLAGVALRSIETLVLFGRSRLDA